MLISSHCGNIYKEHIPIKRMELEKQQIIIKLLAKKNWGGKYDRLEHFKRFPNLKKCLKELIKLNWVIIKQKTDYTGISLNPHKKRDIFEFIEDYAP